MAKEEKNFREVLDKIFNDMSKDEMVFTNEAQFQYELALRLKNCKEVKNVELEVLSSDLSYEEFTKRNKDNGSKFYTDIVVEKTDGSFVAIELKFKTPSYGDDKVKEHITFGGKRFYTFSQGAEDLGCFEYWKDVERLEKFGDKNNPILLNFNKDKKVSQKFAIIMTNCEKYWRDRKDCRSSLCDNFFLVDGKTFKNALCWKIKVFNGKRVSGKTSLSNEGVEIIDATPENYKKYALCHDFKGEKEAKENPVVPIILRGEYKCDWATYIKLKNEELFRYLILEVK